MVFRVLWFFRNEKPHSYDILSQHERIEVRRQDKEKLNAIITVKLRITFHLLRGEAFEKNLRSSGYPENMEKIYQQ